MIVTYPGTMVPTAPSTNSATANKNMDSTLMQTSSTTFTTWVTLYQNYTPVIDIAYFIHIYLCDILIFYVELLSFLQTFVLNMWFYLLQVYKMKYDESESNKDYL